MDSYEKSLQTLELPAVLALLAGKLVHDPTAVHCGHHDGEHHCGGHHCH